ncbi:MAG: Z1 domain-containing protein [Treponema sp.]|nr:Z1 domain-containing protein [Treponema sp.]
MGVNIIEMKYVNKNSNSWNIELDGFYSEHIKKFLSLTGIPDDGISTIYSNAAKTLSYCPNPKNNSIQQETGIVIGKVQSGKTSNFISLISLAFDNGYDIAIVLGGTKKPLLKQNSDRIKEYFHDVKDNVFVLNSNENADHLNEENIRGFLRREKKVIIVGLKSVKQINTIMQIFTNNTLKERPVLIIDDEGDEYSLNTKVKQKKESSTYSAILNFKNSLQRHCYVSVTATPQANLLISKIDELSPDFGVLVPPGNGYCGLDVFHSDDKYTITIPENEEPLIEVGIPASLKKSLAMFFVACAIQSHRTHRKDKLSMLIHISQFKKDHELEYKKVQELIKEWVLKTSDKKDVSYTSVCEIMKDAHSEYAKGNVRDFPTFEEIEDEIIFAINNSHVHKINGDNTLNGEDDFYEYNIYVGGTMLGRGLTIKGLCVTYITRTAKHASNVDTVQQRARWFGYKTKYLDLCRIFAVSKILNEFMDIRDHEEDLWQTIEMTNSQGIEFKNMPRIFSLSDTLKPTRSSVAEVESYTFYSWNKQRIFQDDEDYARSNKNILNQFRENNKSRLQTISQHSGAPFIILRDADYFSVYSELLEKFMFPETSKLNKGILEKLYQLLKDKNLSPNIDVIWMRDGKTSRHPVNKETKIISNYFVGRNPKDLSKPANYEGDDTHFNRPNTMQLQIHMIEDKETGFVSPTLAIYLPNEIISKLTGLVVQKEA